MIETGGKWCGHHRIETIVKPIDVSNCLKWCKKTDRPFCMWNYGSEDGMCMATNQCNKLIMEETKRRFKVYHRNITCMYNCSFDF